MDEVRKPKLLWRLRDSGDVKDCGTSTEVVCRHRNALAQEGVTWCACNRNKGAGLLKTVGAQVMPSGVPEARQGALRLGVFHAGPQSCLA